MQTITVPSKFIEDFSLFCERAGLDRLEQQRLREQVRADFAGLGAHIAETAAVYRFCDATWGYVPSAELMRGFLASRRWWPADEAIFTTMGPMLLARLCAKVAGALPSPEAPGAPTP